MEFTVTINSLLLLIVITNSYLTTVNSRKQWMWQSEEKWDEEWKSGAWDYLDKVAVERSKISVIGSVLIQLFSNPNSSILDVGCGEGAISDFLTPMQKRNYIGLDISKEAIIYGKKKRKDINFVHSVAHEYKPEQKFDVIIFSEMLYYVDHTKLLTQYEQYLKPQGIVIISMYYVNRKSKQQYEKIFEVARTIFNQVDEMEMSGFTSDNDTKRKVKVHFRLEVYRKKES